MIYPEITLPLFSCAGIVAMRAKTHRDSSVTKVTSTGESRADTEAKRFDRRTASWNAMISRLSTNLNPPVRSMAMRYSYLVIIVLSYGLVSAVKAQETIFNVPTTDILGKGKVYGELDVSFKPNDSTALGHFSSFVPRVVAGTGGNVEVGLNVTGNVQPGADSTTLVPTIKYKFYQSKDKSFAMAAGSNIYIPVKKRGYNIGTWSYVEMSKTIKKTRLTAGGYVATKNVFAANASRSGGMFGFEQTINSKFSFATDWITGKHSVGYVTPGVVWKPTSKITTYWAYSIGNTAAREGNHFFLLELGYNFN